MSQTTKRYIISSLITFLTGFAIVLLSDWDNITLNSIQDGSIVALIFVALRTGLKGVIEYLLSLNSPAD